MRLQELMSTPVFTVTTQAPVREAQTLMRGKEIHHVIVTEAGRPVGFLSSYALRDADPTARCRAVMDTGIVTAPPRTTARQAANLFRGRSVSCLAVVEDGDIVGVVTVSDLLELVGGGMDRPAKPERRVLRVGRGIRAKELSKPR